MPGDPGLAGSEMIESRATRARGCQRINPSRQSARGEIAASQCRFGRWLERTDLTGAGERGRRFLRSERRMQQAAAILKQIEFFIRASASDPFGQGARCAALRFGGRLW